MKKISQILLPMLVLAALLISACTGAATPAGDKVNPALVDFTGVIESINGNQWVVNGQTITVDPAIIRDGPFNVGDTIKVEAQVAADGSLTVTRVETPQADDNSNDINSNSANANDANSNSVNGNDSNSNSSNSNDVNGNDDNSNSVNGNDDNGNGTNTNDDNSNDSNSNVDNGGTSTNSNDSSGSSNTNDDSGSGSGSNGNGGSDDSGSNSNGNGNG